VEKSRNREDVSEEWGGGGRSGERYERKEGGCERNKHTYTNKIWDNTSSPKRDMRSGPMGRRKKKGGSSLVKMIRDSGKKREGKGGPSWPKKKSRTARKEGRRKQHPAEGRLQGRS